MRKHAPYPGQKATAGNFGFGIGGLMEIEMGPCAEFSLYHLMDLEPGEERLILDEKAAPSKGGPLLRGSVAIIGKGLPTPTNGDFRSSIVLLRDNLPKPSTKRAHQVVEPSVHVNPVQNPKMLSDLCRILRSKNAGPYEITIDAVFYSETEYRYVKGSQLLSPANVAKALGIPKGDIIWMGFFDPALSFKVTIPRVRSGKKKSAGGFMENDIHGSQEHLGLADLELPKAGASLSAISFSAHGWSRLIAIVAAFWRVGIACVQAYIGK